MSQLVQNPAYLLIEDQLDAVGQKYRVQRLARGAMLFAVCGVVATFAAALGAHYAGQSAWAYAILGAWAAWLLATFVAWFLRPLLIRPRSLDVARLIENRIPGLHNGLTNSVLLARADDLQASPWIPRIFEEILSNARGKSLDEAVRITDLRPLALRLGLLLLPVIALLCVPAVRTNLRHGWRQMFAPAAFVPRTGAVEILEIQPQNATLMAGQSLEVTILARDPRNGMPAARLVFQNHREAAAELPAVQAKGDDRLRYAYRLDNVRDPMRYRVVIDGTESPWFDVNIVRQVKLSELSLAVNAPLYTNQPRRTVALKGDDAGKAPPLSVPEGSRIDLAAHLDVPVTGALLQLGDNPEPAKMAPLGADAQRYGASFAVADDTKLVVQMRQGDQIVQSLPDPPLRVTCVRDAAPVIEMRWPTQDVTVPLDQEVKVRAMLRDDYGLTAARVLVGTAGDQPLAVLDGSERPWAMPPTAAEFDFVIPVDAATRQHNKSVRVQVEVVDNRRIPASGAGRDLGPQTIRSTIYEIKFADAKEIARDQKEQIDKLRALLQQMLDQQKALRTQVNAWKPEDKAIMPAVRSGQQHLRDLMAQTAKDFPFEANNKVVQKVLVLLANGPAREAVDLAAAVPAELVPLQQVKLARELYSKQGYIIDALETLLARLNKPADPATQPATRRSNGDLTDDQREAFKKLDEALKEYEKEQKRILDQTATLAKKPVDNWDAADKKLAEELAMAQEKLDAFMQEKITDFSALAEQDMANAALLKELLEVYSEVTMAKDALKKKAEEIAVPAEEMGLELAKEIQSNLEKWLSDAPDRQKWLQEDPLGKNDIPMAELPKELEDMVGKLLEEQEDLFEDIEDQAANYADSLDKGAGWDAMDGPIANMSAKGVTGNQLPNNNEMNGRSGEGRSGKSSGEMVEETASGKGGRMTPTRLDPTPFQQGQVKDESKDPTGGATGGGKISGQGGQGLEGPVGPKQKEEMQRLTAKQAELRNTAERLQLQYQVGKYDNFKLLEAIALMRRVESDLKSNRYFNALRRRDVTLEALDTSKMLTGAQLHVQHDTTPAAGQKLQSQINDATKGQLPAAWSEALKEYYKNLANK